MITTLEKGGNSFMYFILQHSNLGIKYFGWIFTHNRIEKIEQYCIIQVKINKMIEHLRLNIYRDLHFKKYEFAI